jgi:transcriptional antiterminator
MIVNIQKLIALIHSGNTGSPKTLAEKLGVSERMIYKYIDIIKTDFKAPVKYNRSSKTYYFKTNGKLDLRWQKDSY